MSRNEAIAVSEALLGGPYGIGEAGGPGVVVAKYKDGGTLIVVSGLQHPSHAPLLFFSGDGGGIPASASNAYFGASSTAVVLAVGALVGVPPRGELSDYPVGPLLAAKDGWYGGVASLFRHIGG